MELLEYVLLPLGQSIVEETVAESGPLVSYTRLTTVRSTGRPCPGDVRSEWLGWGGTGGRMSWLPVQSFPWVYSPVVREVPDGTSGVRKRVSGPDTHTSEVGPRSDSHGSLHRRLGVSGPLRRVGTGHP